METHLEFLCYTQNIEETVELGVQICRLAGDSYRKWSSLVEKVKSFRNVDKMRKCFLKGFKFCQDKGKLGKDWLNWEKLFGDAAHLLKCEEQLSRKGLMEVAQEVQTKVTLFVKNLHKDVTDLEIQSLFQVVKGVLGIRVPRQDDGSHKGICFIDVDSNRTAEQILQLNGS